MESFIHLTFLLPLLQIIMIDLVLSGDNAIVIGMATKNLDPRNRKKAIILGTMAAILLRVTFTGIAAIGLTHLPLVQLLGGLALTWIAIKLLVENDIDCSAVSPQKNIFRAVKTIILADFIMSLDNILSVAGASHGNLSLLLIGLLFSMPLLMAGSQILAGLMARLSWLTYLGGIVIAWVAGEMICGEQLLKNLFLSPYYSILIPSFSVMAVLFMARMIKSHQN